MSPIGELLERIQRLEERVSCLEQTNIHNEPAIAAAHRMVPIGGTPFGDSPTLMELTESLRGKDE